MSSEVAGSGTSGAPAQLLLRTAALLIGLAGLAWACSVLPSSWKLASLTDVADLVLADDRLKPAALAQLLPGLDEQPEAPVAAAGIARAGAIIRLSAIDDALDRQDATAADDRMRRAEEAVRASLARNPSDAFLWLTLFLLENGAHGFDPANIRLLAQSYVLGPREGWIALRRNRVALSVFPLLDADLQDRAVAEFAALVDSQFVQEAKVNLEGVGWAQRDRLIAGLAGVDLLPKRALKKMLFDDGLSVDIPGVKIDERPWR